MKRVCLIFLPLLLWAPVNSLAQNKNTIPKVEVSVGGGPAWSGYLASFDGSLWQGHIAQGEGHTPYVLPRSLPWLGGQGGVYVDYHFTKNWGLISGLEAAYYETLIDAMGDTYLFNTFRTVVSSREYWLSIGSWGYNDWVRSASLQIPIMGKFMVPISRKKAHQYYVAAGAKLGFPVMCKMWIQPESQYISIFASRPYPDNGSGSYEIKIDESSGKDAPLTCVDAKKDVYDKQFRLRDKDNGWYPIEASPVDVLLSLDTGFRWDLGHRLGLYTGIYFDFGLLRPIARKPGEKIYSIDASHAMLNNFESSSWDGYFTYDPTSILAADGPDICYLTNPKVDPNSGEVTYDYVFLTNDKPYAKAIHSMQVGIKVRFSFGFGSVR